MIFISPAKVTVKCMEQKLNNKPRYNEILVITSTIQKPKCKMYLDITNKCQHVTEKRNAKQTNKDEALTCSVFQCCSYVQICTVYYSFIQTLKHKCY